MNERQQTDVGVDQPPEITQAQLYDDLRRIGQLEDQKHAIQTEIEEKTERLRSALPQLDSDSLLYQMLSAALQPISSSPEKKPRGRPARKRKKPKTTKRKP